MAKIKLKFIIQFQKRSVLYGPKHFTFRKGDSELFLGGVSISDIQKEFGFKQSDFAPYIPISTDEFSAAKLEVHYMSYYKNWSPQQNSYFVLKTQDFNQIQMVVVKAPIANMQV